MAFLTNFVKGRPSVGHSEGSAPDINQEYSDYFEDNEEVLEKCAVSMGNFLQGPKADSSLLENQPDDMLDELTRHYLYNPEKEDPSMNFFKTLIPDVNKLSETRKSKSKLEVFTLLGRELEQKESEQT